MSRRQDGEEGVNPTCFQLWVTIWYGMWLDYAMGNFALLNNQLTNLDGLMCVCVCVWGLFVCFSFLVAPLSLLHTHNHIHNGKGLKVTPLGVRILIIIIFWVHSRFSPTYSSLFKAKLYLFV